MTTTTTTTTPYPKSPHERNNSNNNVAASNVGRRISFLRSTLICMGLVGLLIFRYPGFIQNYTHSEEIIAKFSDVITNPLNPEHQQLQGRDHFYMIPPSNATENGKPIGVLLYLHSCKQSGREFFTLPEHRIIALDAVQKGLVVFSPTSFDQNSGCYTIEDTKGYLKDVFREFVKTHRLQGLPRVGMGDSSGAAILSFVHQALKLESIAVYNSPQGYGDTDDEESLAIPTVYLSMSADEAIANRMEVNKKRLQDVNITSLLYKVSSRPFTESLCVARIPELPEGFCEHILGTIKKHHSGLLNTNGFVLEGDMKSAQWQRCFERLESDFEIALEPSEKDSTSVPLTRSWLRIVLEQEIQTCYGFHAMTAQFHDEIIRFLMLNSRISDRLQGR